MWLFHDREIVILKIPTNRNFTKSTLPHLLGSVQQIGLDKIIQLPV